MQNTVVLLGRWHQRRVEGIAHRVLGPAPRVHDSVGLAWGPKIRISDKCQEVADTVNTTNSAQYGPWRGELQCRRRLLQVWQLWAAFGTDRPSTVYPEAVTARLASGPWGHHWAH